MKKNIGKPCTGKPYARFDEGRQVSVTRVRLLRHRQTKGVVTVRSNLQYAIPVFYSTYGFLNWSTYWQFGPSLHYCIIQRSYNNALTSLTPILNFSDLCHHLNLGPSSCSDSDADRSTARGIGTGISIACHADSGTDAFPAHDWNTTD